MSPLLSIGVVSILSFGTNLPLGFWREGCRRFSPSWFVAIHASVPLIIATRILLAVGWAFVPLFVALAVAGQLAGGRLRAKNAS